MDTISLVDNYEAAVIKLLTEKAFFAKLIMSMKKDFKFPMPTAAVSIASTGVTLHLNAEFFNQLTLDERVAILTHESLHLVHAHALRFKRFHTGDRGLANVACDVAINQYIPNIPQLVKVTTPDGKLVEGKPVTYEDLVKVIPDLLPKMNSEYYFNKLKQKQQEMRGKGEAEGEYVLTDSHDEWDDTDLTEEQIEKFVKNHVKAILETCSDQEKSVLDKTVIDELYKSDINWRAQLRSFFANSEETFTETTRKKRNRRYGIIHPGNRNEPKLTLGICVDTSGSISDEELKLFFGEIDRIYDEAHMVLHIIEADCVIRDFYQYKRGMKIQAKGRGGTMYGPALKKAKDLKCDAVIYFGDADAADTPENPKIPVMWGIVRNSPPPADFGRVIRIQ